MRRSQLAVEALEDRYLLASVLVTGLASEPFSATGVAAERVPDSAMLAAPSLADAIKLANSLPGPDVIRFDPSLFAEGPQTIDTPVDGLDEISGDLVIYGPGSDRLNLRALSSDSGLMVGPGVTVTIYGITISEAGSSSGIVNQGNLTLDHVAITNNRAALGGGVFNSGNLVLANSTVTENVGSSDGGGIYSDGGTVTLINSAVTLNSSGGSGAGIFTKSASLNATNSTISQNRASGSGGGLMQTDSTATLTNVTIAANVADSDGNGDGMGGGLSEANSAPDASTVLHNTIVAGNLRGAAGTFSDDIIIPGDTVSLSSSNNLIGNPATAGGLTHGVVANIVGNGLGGVLDIDSVLDVNLRVLGGATPVHPLVVDSPAIDGGNNAFVLDASGASLISDQRKFPFRRIVDGDIDIFTPDSEASAIVDIGAYEVQDSQAVTHSGSLVVSTALDEDDGNLQPGELSLREAFRLANEFLDPNVITFTEDVRGTIILQGSPLVATTDIQIDGPGARPVITGSLTAEQETSLNDSTLSLSGDRRSQHLVVDPVASVLIRGLTLLEGRADIRGGSIGNFGQVTIEDSVLTANALTGSPGDTDGGGAIFVDQSATLHVRNSTLDDNSAVSGRGGAVRNVGVMTATDSQFTNNFAELGGAIYNGLLFNDSFRPEVSLDNVLIAANEADQGGGIYNFVGTLSIDDSQVRNNNAIAGDGGGIASTTGIIGFSELYMQNTTVDGNTAAGFSSGGTRLGGTGGGIVANGLNLNVAEIIRSTISNNTAEFGGGLKMSGDVILRNSTVSGNTARSDTGGFGVAGGILVDVPVSGQGASIIDSTIANNTAHFISGGIHNQGNIRQLTNNIIGDNIAEARGVDPSVDRNQIPRDFQNARQNNGTIAGDVLETPSHNLIEHYNSDFFFSRNTQQLDPRFEDGANRNILNQDPGLAPLADNGGLTQTHALNVDSPAVDAGSSNRLFDQAGQPFVDVDGVPDKAWFLLPPSSAEITESIFGTPNVDGFTFLDDISFTIDGVKLELDGDYSFDNGIDADATAVPVDRHMTAEQVANAIATAILAHPGLNHIQPVLQGAGTERVTYDVEPLNPCQRAFVPGATGRCVAALFPYRIELRGAGSVSDNIGTFSALQDSDTEAHDIGSFEGQFVSVVDDWVSHTLDGQFFDVGALGVGYYQPNNPKVIDKPEFFGFEFDPKPFSFGAIGEGLFGDEYGGELTADIRIRAGIEFGYYLDTGSVAVNYEGLATWVLNDPGDGSEVMIDTSADLLGGSLYTTWPKFGAWADLVIEVEITVRGKACVIWCVQGQLPKIDLDFRQSLFSLNDQENRSVVNGRVRGNLETNGTPQLDGQLLFGGQNPAEKLLETAEDKLEEKVKDANLKERDAEIKQKEKERELAKETDPTKRAAIQAEVETQRREVEKQKSRKKNFTKAKGFLGDPCVGPSPGVQVCFGANQGDLLGVQATLQAGVEAGPIGIGKELGSLSLTIPEIELDAQGIEPGTGILRATTDDFVLGSPEDNNRQIAALTVDLAGILGPMIGIPAGKYTVDLGPLSIAAQLLSYNIRTAFNLNQEIEVTPSFGQNSAFEFVEPGTTTPQAVNVRNATTGVVQNGVTEVTFQPGDRLDITPGVGRAVQVVPKVKLDKALHNNLGLDLSVTGIFEALSLSMSAFGETFVDVGPLIRDVHSLGNFDLGSVFDRTTALAPAIVEGLDAFLIGNFSDAMSTDLDGTTTASAFNLAPRNGSQTQSVSIPSGAATEYYLSVPVGNSTGATFGAIEFDVANVSEVVVPEYGLILQGLDPFDGSVLFEQAMNADERYSVFGPFRIAGIREEGVVGKLVVGVRTSGGQASIIQLDRIDPPPKPAIGEIGDEITEADIDQRREVLTASIVDSDGVLDIDNDGVIDPMSDGLLLVRYMAPNNLRGDALIAGAVNAAGNRTTASEIEAYIQGILTTDRFDLDGDGSISATTDGRLLMRHLAQWEGTLSDAEAEKLDGSLTSPTVDLSRLNNSGFTSRSASDTGGTSRQSIDKSALPGVSAYNPLPLETLDGSTGTVTFQDYGRFVKYDQTYLADINDPTVRTLVASGATGTPQRPTGVGPDDPTDQASINEFSRRLRMETRTAELGVDEAMFVQLGIADGYEFIAPAGVTFTRLVFDPSAGDNAFFDHLISQDGTEADFELFLPDTNQRFDITMNPGDQPIVINGSEGVSRFHLIRKDLPQRSLQGVATGELPDIDLAIGVILSGDVVAPTVTVNSLGGSIQGGSTAALTADGPAQTVTLSATANSVQFGETVNVVAQYNVEGSLTTSPGALTIQVHYDSSAMTFDSFQNSLAEGFSGFIDSPETIPDGDADTDRMVQLIWFNDSGDWPVSGTLPIELGQFRFTALNQTAVTSVNVTRNESQLLGFNATNTEVTIVPTTFLVDNAGDTNDNNFTPGNLTLREAIDLANASTNQTTIEFSSTLSAIALTTELPALKNGTSVAGPGADQLTITGPAAGGRILSVDAGGAVSLSGLTLTGGNVVGSGGAILNSGTLTLDSVRLVGNMATEDGGAVLNIGTLNLSNSEVSENHAGRDGGGILLSGTANVVNSTISNNTANGQGGGVVVTGSANLTLRSSTVVGNRSNVDGTNGGTAGGLMQVGNGNLLLHNTLVAGNREVQAGAASDIPCDIIGVVNSLSAGNLVSDPNTTGALNPALSNIIGDGSGNELTLASVVESSLAFVGATRAHRLVTGSPAIDAGRNGTAVATDGSTFLMGDQSGAARFFGAAIDIGAVEVVPNAGFSITPPATPTVSESGTSVEFQVVLNAPPANSVTLMIGSSDTGEAIPMSNSVTFTAGNWNVPQMISVAGISDSEADGDQTSSITVSIDTANSDPSFALLPQQSFTVTTTDATNTQVGNVDGDGDFDANDAFLIQLFQLAGSNAQIDQSKGASSLTAAEIRANIAAIGLGGDVDGDNDFDANDSFLIQLVKLAGSDTQIDQTKGGSPLTAVQIRANVNSLGSSSGQQVAASAPSRLAAVMAEPQQNQLSLFEPPPTTAANAEYSSPAAAAVPDSIEVWTDFRSWIDAL